MRIMILVREGHDEEWGVMQDSTPIHRVEEIVAEQMMRYGQHNVIALLEIPLRAELKVETKCSDLRTAYSNIHYMLEGDVAAEKVERAIESIRASPECIECGESLIVDEVVVINNLEMCDVTIYECPACGKRGACCPFCGGEYIIAHKGLWCENCERWHLPPYIGCPVCDAAEGQIEHLDRDNFECHKCGQRFKYSGAVVVGVEQ